MTRKPGRPPERSPRKRMPPAEETAEEASYLERLKQRATPVVAHLMDGTELHGRIEYFDRDMIKIHRPSGPHQFVRKVDVRYIVESEAAENR